ncbi:tRNA-uridine aminocarboxypropyltransferase [Bordetella petrii]|uniref:tRNA-uridine aminocarboxypropyltransferase n=1 Tax=Bordetella petrii TaxID=94624 RepID=UPI001E2E308C|nr:DTW domain-containing protein [Bordetella petrii]MCD0504017.1 DTW domain-containing protein [Bordetella petrii]
MHTFPDGRNLAVPARRPACANCLRPQSHCLCAWIPALDSRTRVLVLQHPDEARHALNTGRLAVLGLNNACLHVGRQFDARLWRQPGCRACLLFPEDGAEVLAAGGTGAPDAGPPRLLVVLDGTWRQARQMLAAHPGLAALPRVTLPGTAASQYRIRHAGLPQALSTIEAVALALDALEAPARYSALLAPFEQLVAGQIAAMGEQRYQRDHVQRAGSRALRHKNKPPAA